jgi:hypothetical protein
VVFDKPPSALGSIIGQRACRVRDRRQTSSFVGPQNNESGPAKSSLGCSSGRSKCRSRISPLLALSLIRRFAVHAYGPLFFASSSQVIHSLLVKTIGFPCKDWKDYDPILSPFVRWCELRLRYVPAKGCPRDIFVEHHMPMALFISSLIHVLFTFAILGPFGMWFPGCASSACSRRWRQTTTTSSHQARYTALHSVVLNRHSYDFLHLRIPQAAVG